MVDALEVIEQHLEDYQEKGSQFYKYEINALKAVKEDIENSGDGDA